MAIRFMRPGKKPFFITKENDGFTMAKLSKGGLFIGWREHGTRFESKTKAFEALESVKQYIQEHTGSDASDLIVGEIL